MDSSIQRWQRAHLIDVRLVVDTTYEPDNLRRVGTTQKTGYLDLRYAPRTPRFNSSPTTDDWKDGQP